MIERFTNGARAFGTEAFRTLYQAGPALQNAFQAARTGAWKTIPALLALGATASVACTVAGLGSGDTMLVGLGTLGTLVSAGCVAVTLKHGRADAAIPPAGAGPTNGA